MSDLNNLQNFSDQEIDQQIANIDKQMQQVPTFAEIEKTIINEMVTVQDVVRYMVSLFAQTKIYLGHGTDNYWAEALEIVLAVMRLQPPCDDSTLSSKLSKAEKELIAQMTVTRIKYRLPVAYLTHRAFFADHQFYVDRRVIIPRSSFAEIIKNKFKPFIQSTPMRALDMCTGSGCIAIAMALAFEGECEVDAVDISADALEVCNRNIQDFGLEDFVIPIQSDLFANLPQGDQYDLIVSNPPYVNRDDLEDMPEEYHSEPEIALGSGNDGLDCTRKILANARRYLKDDGVLIVEVGNSAENLVEVYPQVPFTFVDIQNGECGIFVLTAKQLDEYQAIFDAACN